VIPLRDDVQHRRSPAVNYLLIIANIVVFILQLRHGSNLDRFAAVPSAITEGRDLYTVLTSMFMHGGLFHILSNMWFLFVFGDNVEDAFGHFGYLIIYLIAGVCGAMLQILMSPHSSVPMVGASGAISGVLGAYLIFYPRARILTLVPIFFFIRFMNIPAFIFLGLWFAMQLLSGLATPHGGGGVAFFAHIGGFSFGLVVALIARMFRRRGRPVYTVY
jgi:membrane associated rhomboid family serine protease